MINTNLKKRSELEKVFLYSLYNGLIIDINDLEIIFCKPKIGSDFDGNTLMFKKNIKKDYEPYRT